MIKRGFIFDHAFFVQYMMEMFSVKAYPNPFNSTVKFVVHTAKAGNGRIELKYYGTKN